MTRFRPISLRRFGLGLLLVSLLPLLADPAAASNATVGLAGASQDDLVVPWWLYPATGGTAVGASALLASFITDRRFIERVHLRQTSLGAGVSDRLLRVLRVAGGVLGPAVLALVASLGYIGPQVPTVNSAIIVVFAGLYADYTMLSYLVADTWRALNPQRTLVSVASNGFASYPERLDRWPAVTGILALVWVETVTAVTTRLSVLATASAAYSVVTPAGAVAVGADAWFDKVDPVSVFPQLHGRVTPICLDDDGLSSCLPGVRFVIDDDLTDLSDVAAVVVLVWKLTFSGLVTTEQGAATVRWLAGVGFSSLFVYGLLCLDGFGVFLGLYVLAVRVAAYRIDTLEMPLNLAVTLAPSLLAIAAGYHLAHYVGFFVSSLSILVHALSSPLSLPANPVVFTLPAWFGGLNVTFVLLGHLLVVWVVHLQAYRTFPSRLQAVRSQLPLVVVIILYTIFSLWPISPSATNSPFL